MLNMNTQQALDHYGINFDVVKAPMVAFVDGKAQHVPNVNAMVRTDTNEVLSGVSVSNSYEIVQTRSYADIIERITGELNADFVKGGVFKGGRLTYLQCKLPDTIRVKGTNDVIEEYLTFVNSFDGSSRFMILPTLTRIFCNNQMNALRREARNNGLRFSHTRSVKHKIQQADKAILEAMNAYKAFSVKIDWLADTKFTNSQMDLVAQKMFNVKSDTKPEDVSTRTRNNVNKLCELFEDGIGLAQWRGTAWAAYNACTEFVDHDHRATRKNTDKFENKLIGSGAAFKQRALNVIESVIAA